MFEAGAGSACARAATMAVRPRESSPRRFALLTMRATFSPLLHSKSRRIARSNKADRQSDAAAITRARCAATTPSKRASSSASGPVRPRFSNGQCVSDEQHDQGNVDQLRGQQQQRDDARPAARHEASERRRPLPHRGGSGCGSSPAPEAAGSSPTRAARIAVPQCRSPIASRRRSTAGRTDRPGQGTADCPSTAPGRAASRRAGSEAAMRRRMAAERRSRRVLRVAINRAMMTHIAIRDDLNRDRGRAGA